MEYKKGTDKYIAAYPKGVVMVKAAIMMGPLVGWE
jgi:hypothetical protein